MRLPALLLTLPLAAASAQEPEGEGTDELARLRRDLVRAHRLAEDLPPLDRMVASLVLETIGRERSNVVVSAKVRFLLWRRDDGRERALIHTVLEEGDEPLQRGIDRRGPWLHQNGTTSRLLGADDDQERAAIRREAHLARQLLSVLDPAAALDRLVDPGPVTRAELVRGRRGTVDCRTVTGRVEAFPFHGLGGEPAPARVRLWVGDGSGRLVAVEAWPLDAGGDPRPVGEMVRMEDHREVRGILLPRRLVLHEQEGEVRRAVLKVSIVGIDLEPELGVEAMDRPR